MKGGEPVRLYTMRSPVATDAVQSKRIDSVLSNDNYADKKGFTSKTEKKDDDTRFERILAEVTDNNASAKRVTDRTVAGRSVDKADPSDNRSEMHRGNGNGYDTKNSAADETYEKVVAQIAQFDNSKDEVDDDMNVTQCPEIKSEVTADAEEIIVETLSDISQMFNLSLVDDLSELSFEQISDETKEQLAEIVFVLKKMVQGFELCMKDGIALHTPAQTIEAPALKSGTDTLRTAVFRLEMACSALGIADQVQQEISAKMEKPASTGIVQATDPLMLSMAEQHTEKLFGPLFTGDPTDFSNSTNKNGLNELIIEVKKMAMMAEGQYVHAKNIATGEGVATNNEAARFDASIYRTLLKIEPKQQVTVEDGAADAAAADGKSLLPGQAKTDVTVTQDQDSGLSCAKSYFDLKTASMQGVASGAGGGGTSTLARTNDDTVMEQVTPKLQFAMRSGLTEMRIQLRPESLGDMRMRIRVEGDVVLAKIEVENQQVKEILERNLPMLKDALSQQSLSAGSFEIRVSNNSDRHPDGMPQESWGGNDGASEEYQNRHGNDSNDASDQFFEAGIEAGHETGRRFGDNSVEYFA